MDKETTSVSDNLVSYNWYKRYTVDASWSREEAFRKGIRALILLSSPLQSSLCQPPSYPSGQQKQDGPVEDYTPKQNFLRLQIYQSSTTIHLDNEHNAQQSLLTIIKPSTQISLQQTDLKPCLAGLPAPTSMGESLSPPNSKNIYRLLMGNTGIDHPFCLGLLLIHSPPSGHPWVCTSTTSSCPARAAGINPTISSVLSLPHPFPFLCCLHPFTPIPHSPSYAFFIRDDWHIFIETLLKAI
jgi:hypothetical protein